MRVIAGNFGGRIFESPGTHKTHPMSDKVRGALFNILGDIEGLIMLDAFAGSGALGFEALSRGAKHVTFLDNDRVAQTTIAQNIKTLGIANHARLIMASANAWLTTNKRTSFDIVLCDPPYDNIQRSLLLCLAERVRLQGLFVLSVPPKESVTLSTKTFECEVEKDYGDARLVFYRRVR